MPTQRPLVNGFWAGLYWQMPELDRDGLVYMENISGVKRIELTGHTKLITESQSSYEQIPQAERVYEHFQGVEKLVRDLDDNGDDEVVIEEILKHIRAHKAPILELVRDVIAHARSLAGVAPDTPVTVDIITRANVVDQYNVALARFGEELVLETDSEGRVTDANWAQ